MKKIYKILTIIVISITILSLTTISYGFGIKDLTGTQDEQVAGLKSAGNTMITVITTIGIVISVVILIVIGIKYMMGSTAEKAEYKKSLMPYVIGAGILFSASSIAQIIYDLAIKM